ncbi:MAG: response regulator transcription factor [Betaproteobacteria bacterium]|nr:response regulator transcription factor [Betaproteobacteria bacterium]
MEVLLIDDQAVTVQVYAAIARRTFPGARVTVALDLSEGLQIAMHRKIDLVLLDLQLQNSVGVQTLNKFRRACPGTPVLVVTGVDDKETIHACLKAGAVGYVPKTSAVQTLRTALEAVSAGKLYIPPEAKIADLKAANGG